MDFDIFQTKQELNCLVNDFKKFNTVFRFISLVIYIVFLIYSIVAKTGYLAINIFLLVITVSYTVFVAVCTWREYKGVKDKANKLISKIYRYVKFSATVLSAFLSVLSILTAVEQATPFKVVLAILLPVCLILQLLFDLAVFWITLRVQRFQVAITQDLNMLKRDMKKIIMGFIKTFLFSKEKSKPLVEPAQEEELIIVGSDVPRSLKDMKRVEDTRKKKEGNVFSRAFKKLFGKKNQQTNPPVGEEEMQPEGE